MNGYGVDLVLVIDKTGSMRDIFEGTKQNALVLRQKIEQKLAEEKQEGIGLMRVRVIGFGALDGDGVHTFVSSDFFELPGDESDFRDFVAGVRCEGGGEESGLAALSLALGSDWMDSGRRTRHIIAMFTDEDSASLEKDRRNPACPEGVASNMSELSAQWMSQDINQRGKRLIMVAPSNTVYDNEIAYRWDHSRFFELGRDIQTMNFDAIVSVISSSISA